MSLQWVASFWPPSGADKTYEAMAMRTTTSETAFPGDPLFSWAERLEIFYGQANPGECRLYVRLAGLEATDGWRLTGRVRGPECRYAQTLPADYPLRSHEPGATLLAEAFIPDPCFWSAGLPQLYWATVELVRDGKTCGSATRMVGMRPLGARGRSLYWEGKRWVLRGIVAGEVADSSAAELNAWHNGPTAMLVDHPADELCERASVDGVLIVARIGGPQERLAAELGRLAQWPSVGLAIVDGIAAGVGAARSNAAEVAGVDLTALRQLARNILLAQFVARGSGDNAVTPIAGAHAVVVELDHPGAPAANSRDLAAMRQDCPVPLIAYRPAGPQSSVIAGRAACDLLQSDLAPIGDFAGYIV